MRRVRRWRWREFGSRLLLVSAVATFATAPGSHATPALLLEQDRGVFSRASAAEAAAFDEEIASDEAVDTTPFVGDVQSTGLTAGAAADAAANLDSDLDGSLIEAVGAASTGADTPLAGTRAEAPADSFFEVIFEATASESFTLQGSIEAAAVDAHAFASVEFVDLDTATVLATYEAPVGIQFAIDDAGMLVAGHEYRLTAFALAYSLEDLWGSAQSADASYEVMLVLPEPSQNAALACAVAALAGLYRLRRRANRFELAP